MHILIIDDSTVWIKQGKKLLEQSGQHKVTEIVVSDPKQFISKTLSGSLIEKLKGVDVLLIDEDFGQEITSTRIICVVRSNFPRLPIIRWTSGHGLINFYGRRPYMDYLGVSPINKPTKKDEMHFIEVFEEAFEDQGLILSGPMGIFAALDEIFEVDEYVIEDRLYKLEQIAGIAQLAEKDEVLCNENQNYPWMTTGQYGAMTSHELGHCICDGSLTVDDIRPHFSDLQKVVKKFEVAGGINEQFQICAEFIKKGNLGELELVRGCY